jgi:hypothetical protein
LANSSFGLAALLRETALQVVYTLARTLHLFVRIDAHAFDSAVHIGGELGHVGFCLGTNALQLNELKNARRA